MPGRPRVPKAVKILKGTFRKDRDAGVEAAGKPAPPSYLDREAKAHWRAIVPALDAMNILGAADSTMLAMACFWHVQWRRAAEAMAKADVADLKTTRKLMGVASLAATHYDKIMARFGTSPADRMRLKAENAPRRSGVPSRRRD